MPSIRWISATHRLDVVVYGNPPSATEDGSILICNHFSEADWISILLWANKCGFLTKIKMFLKKSVLYVPFVGYGLYILGWIFVQRDWAKDKKRIESAFSQLRRLNSAFWIFSFVEATRLTPEKLKLAQIHAMEKKYDWSPQHVLLPRAKGFVATVRALKGRVKTVHDLTLQYDVGTPIPFAGSQMVSGAVQTTAHIFSKKYTIPHEWWELDEEKAEEMMHKFLLDIWKAKDQRIAFFQAHGTFDGCPDYD